MDITLLNDTINGLESRSHKIDGYFSALIAKKKELEKEKNLLQNEIQLLTKTGTVLKHMLDVMVRDEMSKMASLITYGLKTVFHDQDLSFLPVITKKGDKVHIELNTCDRGIQGSYDSFGGSVAVIESFLLRILCVLKMKLARFMLLDETFASVGWEYIQNTGKLVQELSKKMGLDILLVTHQNQFQECADHVYRVKESKDGLIMEKLK